MYKNKALIDRTLNTPSENDNTVMTYRRLISLIERYNMLARDKRLPVKAIPVYNNSVNCSLMIKSVTSILKDIDRVKNIKDTDNDDGDDGGNMKIKTDVTFDENGAFTEGIWTYTANREANGVISVVLNVDKFSEAFNGNAVALNYDYMPYEKLIDTSGNEYLTASYGSMFMGLPNTVTTLTIDNWTNINVTSMTGMFQECSSLKSLTLGDNFDTSSARDMAHMFRGCSSLESLTLGTNFNTSSVEDMGDMFSGCDKLESISLYQSAESIIGYLPLGTWGINDTYNTVVAYEGNGTDPIWNPADLPDSWADAQWTLTRTDKTKRGVTFGEGNTFTEGNWVYTLQDDDNVSVVLNPANDYSETLTFDYDDMPYEKLIDIAGNECQITSYDDMFNALTTALPMTIITQNFNNWTNRKVTNMRGMIVNQGSIETISLNNFDTSDVTDMRLMFQMSSSLTTLTLGNNFDTSNVTNMNGMFNGCSKLESLDLGNKFDTSKVTNMVFMFRACEALTTLALGTNFNTSSVEDMEGMFYNCRNLTTLTLCKSAKSLIDRLPSGTWNINGTDNTVTVVQNSSATWDPPELPNSWGDEQWTLTRTIQQTS